jgi:hypothetical protein
VTTVTVRAAADSESVRLRRPGGVGPAVPVPLARWSDRGGRDAPPRAGGPAPRSHGLTLPGSC